MICASEPERRSVALDRIGLRKLGGRHQTVVRLPSREVGNVRRLQSPQYSPLLNSLKLVSAGTILVQSETVGWRMTVRDEARSEASRLAQFMGLPKWREFNDLRLVEAVELGFPVSTADTVVRRMDPEGSYIRIQDIIPKSTYYRLKELRKPLTKVQSEKVLALSKVFHETLRQYHGETRTAAMFLARGHPMLGGRSPLEISRDSIAGANLVLSLLARAEAGVAA